MYPSSVQDPLKAWKSLNFPPIKTKDFKSVFLKVSLVFLTSVILITLFFYLLISHRSPYHYYPAFKHLVQRHTNSTATVAAAAAYTNISHILFGIAGSVNTWHERHYYTELWWNRNTTRGFVWLERKPLDNETWPQTSPPYKVSANTSSFKYTCWYGSRSAIRIARIVKESFELGLKNVRWFVMGDDDTVFFVDNLITVLAKYDHNQMYYIGGNSESVEQDVIHSYNMAYGGGGFAISYPLAAELVKILDGCIDRYAKFYGSDQKIQGCISEIGVQVTNELGFHQVDIRGNPYGLVAAHPVAPLVSLHHWDSVEPLFPSMSRIDSARKLMEVYKRDPGRTLQRSFCLDLRRNWSLSVSWGYSVELYPFLETAKQLETRFGTFQTWRSRSDQPFTFSTRAIEADPCGRPLIFFMDRIEDMDSGQTRSTSIRYVAPLEKECQRLDYAPALGVDAVNVSASHFNPELWKKAPRRQCCEIINGEDATDNVIQVKIRGCNAFESVTPT